MSNYCFALSTLQSNLHFDSYAQAADDLLEDMRLPIIRSGGNWFNWVFKTINISELASLTQERAEKRAKLGSRHLESSL